MNNKETTAKTNAGPEQPDNQRRSFIWKSGAAFSAVLASAVAGMGKADAAETDLQQQVDRLSEQLATLEDSNAIRAVHRRYGDHLGKGEYEEIVNMFADDGDVLINGNVYSGKEYGVRRLYVEQFGGGISGEQTGPVHAMLREDTEQQDSIAIAPDRKTATASFPCLTQVAETEETNAPFLEMARSYGQGIRQRWEAGIYENTYVRTGNTWKIKRLVYRPDGRVVPGSVA